MDISLFLETLQQSFETLLASIGGNPMLTAVVTIWGFFDCILGFVEFIDEGKSVKLLLQASVLTLAAIALCIFMNPLFALLLIELAILLMILYSAKKRNRKKEHIIGKIIEVGDNTLPSDSGLTTSREYKRAVECIGEGRPRAAIEYLSLCRGKITGQYRFFKTYADALIQLENFSGALAKLNSIPLKRLNQKSVFKSVTTRKAHCYRGLYAYTKELECYNALLSKNVEPEKFYFRRSQVKFRMLEVCPYLEQVERMITETFGSQRAFIESILVDLDKALHYNKRAGQQYEGEILSYKGACRIYLEEYREGKELLTQAKEKNEFCANTYVYLGIYYYHIKERSLSISELCEAIDRDKNTGAASDVASFYLAKTYFEMGEYDSAIRYAAQSLSVFPCRSDCFGIQGDCYKKKIMYSDAIKCYTKAITLKPKVQYYDSRAICYYNLNGDSEKAYRDMQEILKLEKRDSYQLRAMLYKAAMDRKKGVRKDLSELRELLASFQDKPNFFLNLGLIYKNYNHLEESESYYRKALEKDPKNDIAHYDLALLLLELGRIGDAVEELNAAIEIEPMSVRYYKTLSECYRDMGDPQNEIQTRSHLSEVKRRLASVNKMNGDDVYRFKRYQAAIDYYQAALSYSPSAAVFNNLACIYFDQEQYVESIECLEKAIKHDRNYFLAYFNLGNCQLRMNAAGAGEDMRKAAEKNFQTAVSLNAGFEKAALMLKSMNAEIIELIPDTDIALSANS